MLSDYTDTKILGNASNRDLTSALDSQTLSFDVFRFGKHLACVIFYYLHQYTDR